MKTKTELKQLGVIILIQLNLFIPILGKIYIYEINNSRPSKVNKSMY